MFMRELFQLADLSKNLSRGKEVRSTADLHLSAHVDSTNRPSEDDLVNGIIPTMQSTARMRTHRLNRHTLILGINHMVTLPNTANQKPPLRMEETGFEGDIFPIGTKLQEIDTVFGNGQVVIITRLINEGKDAIGNTNRVQNEKQPTRLEQDVFHIRLAGQPLAPSRQFKQPRDIVLSQAADNVLCI
jgi:hypothetical protein